MFSRAVYFKSSERREVLHWSDRLLSDRIDPSRTGAAQEHSRVSAGPSPTGMTVWYSAAAFCCGGDYSLLRQSLSHALPSSQLPLVALPEPSLKSELEASAAAQNPAGP
ncbi:hypothetical protein H4Q26_018419 [Puccinia striiformis f. sp. tritici PST-130]|nr:hypothetical protein H4Q26_018419 [Puccinia striiformis f. sp. tritici PST-130]